MDGVGNKQAELSDSLARMIRTVVRNYTVFEGVAKNIDADPTNPESQFTCDVVVDDGVQTATFSGVPLVVMIGSAASLLVIPEEGSNVLMCFRDGNQDRPQLLKVDQAQKVIIDPGTVTQFNDGSNGGLVLLNPLVTHMNTLENDRNTLRDAIQGWVPVADDGGAALKTALLEWLGATITPTKTTDLENTNVTQ